MSKEVTNKEIMQAIIELSQQQKETSDRVGVLSQQVTDMDKKLGEKIDIVDAKVDILSNRLLETEAEVNVLKGAR